jgi:hypothetical protein
MKPRLQRSLPFLALAAIDLLWCSYLFFSRRVPLGHDGFQYLYLKFYFFNDFVRNGELAQWFPYLTHGSPSAWWYVVQSGIFDAVGMFATRLLQIKDFLPVFYVLLFAEKSVFLAGMWLLASEHFKSRVAVFAVSAAMTTTSIWYTQPWWNFHAVMALPLLLFLVHRAIVDFRWIWLCSSALLFFLQTFGHLSYYLPITLLFVAGYAVLLLLTHPDARNSLRSRLCFSAVGIMFFLSVAIALLVVAFWLQRSSNDIYFGSSSRNPDGGVSLRIFLNYAGNTDLRTWSQMMTGLTPHLDFTMFGGFFVFGLLVLTFSEKPMSQTQKLFAWLTIGVALLAAASPLAILVYYLWPLGRYFRHLVLLQPVTKLFCILLAGATFDRLVSSPSPFRRPRVFGLTAVLLPSALLLSVLAVGEEQRTQFLDAMRTIDLPFHPGYPMSPRRLYLSITMLAATWILLVQLMRHFNRPDARRRTARLIAFLLLLDVSLYHRTEMRARTQKLTESEASVFAFTPLPYVEQRSDTPEASGNLRSVAWTRPLSKAIGEEYWSLNLLWMVDSYQTTRRTVFWSEPLQALLQARWPETGKYGEVLPLPLNDKLLTRFGGRDAPKTLFFAQAIACGDAASTAHVLADPNYDGALPLLTLAASDAGISTLPCNATAIGAANAVQSPLASAKIVEFRSNRATFQVDNSSQSPLLMTYSDAWSPLWSVRVNGEASRLTRVALAYKGVVVPPGRSVVEFEFHDKLETLVFTLQTSATVPFVIFLGWLIYWSMAEPVVAASKEDPRVFSSSTT